jgi:uncharacterized protein YegL
MSSLANILGGTPQVRPLSLHPGAEVNPAQAGQPRLAAFIVVDRSGSTGEGINPDLPQIENSLAMMVEQLRQPLSINPLGTYAATIDMAIAAYGDEVELIQPWEQVDKLQPIPKLTAGGGTHTAAALLAALDYVARRLRYYDTYQPAPIPKAIPHIFHLTDGAPTDVEPGDTLWTAVQELLQRVSGDKEKPFSMITHFISPNGMTEGHNPYIRDSGGNPLTGYQMLAQWTGGDVVHELTRAPDMFDNLMRVIVKSVGGASSTGIRINDALKRFNVNQIKSTGSNSFLAPAAKKKPG